MKTLKRFTLFPRQVMTSAIRDINVEARLLMCVDESTSFCVYAILADSAHF